MARSGHGYQDGQFSEVRESEAQAKATKRQSAEVRESEAQAKATKRQSAEVRESEAQSSSTWPLRFNMIGLYGVPFLSKLKSMWHFIFLVRIHDGNLLKSPLSGCIYSIIALDELVFTGHLLNLQQV